MPRAKKEVEYYEEEPELKEQKKKNSKSKSKREEQSSVPSISSILRLDESTDITKRVDIEILSEDKGIDPNWVEPHTKAQYTGSQEEVNVETANIPKDVQDKVKAQLAQEDEQVDEVQQEAEAKYLFISSITAERKMKKILKTYPEYENEFLEIEDPRIRLDVIEKCIVDGNNDHMMKNAANVVLKGIEQFVCYKAPWLKIKGAANNIVNSPEWDRSMTALNIQWRPYLDDVSGGLISSPYTGLVTAIGLGVTKAYTDNVEKEEEFKNRFMPPVEKVYAE